MNQKIKICGVRNSAEINLLDDLDVSYAGLWYGIPQGRYNLDLQSLVNLSSIPTKTLKFVLVTMAHDINFLREAIIESGASGIQFHGFQLPAVIKRIKQEFGDSVNVFKVLHVRNNNCVENEFIERYIDAGTDVFILDSYQDKYNIGSTGIRIEESFIEKFFSAWNFQDKTMIAGGVDETTIARILEKHNIFGVDIDSAARLNGAINRQKVNALMSARNIMEFS